MSIHLTELAAEQLRKVIVDQELDQSKLFLRVGTAGTGAKREYTLDLTETTGDDDARFESEGFNIVCSTEDVQRLDETKIDFRDSGGMRGFTFDVPDKQHVTHGQDSDQHAAPTEEKVREALYLVNDPEVGVNVLDLGLVRELKLEGRNVSIRMTLTTPACPLEEHIRGEIDQRVREFCPGVDAIGITIVWEPKWAPEQMTEEGKRQLGWSR